MSDIIRDIFIATIEALDIETVRVPGLCETCKISSRYKFNPKHEFLKRKVYFVDSCMCVWIGPPVEMTMDDFISRFRELPEKDRETMWKLILSSGKQYLVIEEPSRENKEPENSDEPTMKIYPDDEREDFITSAEMLRLFGSLIPVEAVLMQINSPTDRPVSEIRQDLEALAKCYNEGVLRPKFSQKPETTDDIFSETTS